MEIVKVNPSEYGIEEKKANELLSNLPQIISERSVLEPQYNEIIQMDIELPETAKRAAELRKLIKNNRTKGIEVWHKNAKDYFLKGGQFVDAIKRKEVAVNERMETTLEEIEKYQEKKIAEAKAKLKSEREAELQQYCENVSLFPLGEMTAEAYEQLLNGQKLAHAAKIEAERKAAEEKLENERKERVLRERHLELAKYAQFINLAELTLETTQENYERLLNIALGNKQEYEEEQARIKAENDRLKKEAEEKEKALQAERDKADAERKAAEAKAQKEREEQEKVLAAERKAASDALKKQQEEAARLAQELADKKAAEEKAEADRLAKIEAELAMGDADKMKQLIEDIEALKTKYSFKSKKHNSIYSAVFELLTKVVTFINDKNK